MDDYRGSDSTSTYADYESATGWVNLNEPVRRPPAMRMRRRGSVGALPGIVITAEISENEEHRRTLRGMFARLTSGRLLSQDAMYAAEGFLEALPRHKQLPRVAPDGEGGLLMAWDVPGEGRTLITVGDWVLYAVARAGTAQAHYFDDTPFEEVIPDELLAAIPG